MTAEKPGRIGTAASLALALGAVVLVIAVLVAAVMARNLDDDRGEAAVQATRRTST